jgi:trigger factor
MEQTVKELSNSRVEVEVEVPAADVGRAVSRAARSLAREMRMPGFRKGKAPPSLVIQRVGFGAVLEEAIREALPEWYERALLASGIAPVGDPRVEVVSAPEGEDEPLAFKFQIGVRPEAKLGEYRGLEVGRAEPEAPEEIVDREVERIREGFEEQLAGASAGETREVAVGFPDDYRAEDLAGKEAVFKVEVKEVREKVLPPLDDDFASEASEFDTVEELRADIGKRLAEVVGERIEQDFRVAAVDAAAERATVELPEELVAARAAERWERVERQLAARGMSADSYLQLQGKSREQVIEESKPDAEAELKREAVLAAIAEAEGIEVSEEEMLEALAHTAEHERTTPEKLLKRLREGGRDSMVREDIRIRKAIDLVAEAAKPIPLERAEARERLWTPEKEREEAGSLWTPGSD